MKKFKILIFIISTLTITSTFFGCGNLIPYAMQPSYHEFKQMCELNKLPNNEEKYNKILAYFDLSLDSLDWDKLNEKTWKLKEDNKDYIPNVIEYKTFLRKDNYSNRIEAIAIGFFSNEPQINRNNIKKVEFEVWWDTKRYHYYFSSPSYTWRKVKDYTIWCGDIIKE